jgi:hypothetical protein
MLKRARILLLVLIAVVFFSGAAQASLSAIGTATYGGQDYNLIYASDQHLVWLDYTRGYDTWSNQVSWASGLNNAGILTYHLNSGISVAWSGDWRLPTTPGTTWGYTNEGEMGHLYYDELGQPAGGPLGNTSPFTHLQPVVCWSGTEYALIAGYAWHFGFYYGHQNDDGKDLVLYALAVRSGDVGAPVPIPGALLLFAPGLAGLVAVRRRFKK